MIKDVINFFCDSLNIFMAFLILLLWVAKIYHIIP